MGDTLVFTDGEAVFISNLRLLRENRVIAQMRLGKTFGPERVRILDSTAIVMGKAGGTLILDLANPEKPRVVSTLHPRASGKIRDAVRVDGRIFLLGARGVQLLDPTARQIVEAIDVEPRERVARTGRHLVLVGDEKVQVLDALPFAAPRPAKRGR